MARQMSTQGTDGVSGAWKGVWGVLQRKGSSGVWGWVPFTEMSLVFSKIFSQAVLLLFFFFYIAFMNCSMLISCGVTVISKSGKRKKRKEQKNQKAIFFSICQKEISLYP